MVPHPILGAILCTPKLPFYYSLDVSGCKGFLAILAFLHTLCHNLRTGLKWGTPFSPVQHFDLLITYQIHFTKPKKIKEFQRPATGLLPR